MPIHEQRHLAGKCSPVGEGESGRVAKGGCVHGCHPSQRTRSRRDAARLRIRLDLGETLVRRDLELPRVTCHGGHGDHHGQPREAPGGEAPFDGAGGDDRRDRGTQCRNRQGVIGRQEPEHAHGRGSTEARSHEARPVHPSRPGRLATEGQQDRERARREREGEQQIHARETRPGAGVPRELCRIDGDALGCGRAEHERRCRRDGDAGKPALHGRALDVAGQREQRAAGAEPQHRHADRHVGEMVELLDCEDPHEQDLVGEDGGRDQPNGRQPGTIGGAQRSSCSMGTKRTGMRLRVVTSPSSSLRMRMRCCAP